MSGPGVGFEYPSQEVSWLKRDALLFANSIGCTSEELHFLYELDPNFAVFPTYPLILMFKETHPEVVDFYAAQKSVTIPGVPVFDPTRVVDGQRLLEFLKPLPTSSAGRKFEVRTKVLGVYDKGKPGSVVETQTDIVDAATNESYARVTTSSFYVGQGNWGGPKGPATVNFPPPEGKKPDLVLENQTTNETPLLYRLNGDYNPLHAHPEPGAKMGFGGVIIHGLYSWNWACHGLLQHLGGSNPANFKEYQARFASPVRPGDKLILEAWKTGEFKGEWEEIRFIVKNSHGKVVLSNGRALIKTATIGQRRSYDGALCTVRYIGEVAGTTGSWLGVEWDDTSRGKHDGQHKGTRYFTCESQAPTSASFVRPTRPADPPQTFLSALQYKYAPPEDQQQSGRPAPRPIVFSGKVAEEVGFEKVRRQQAQLGELQYVILDSTKLATAYSGDEKTKGQQVGQVCPKIRELDLSRNLLEHFDPVVEICTELPLLRSLKVNWNRFRSVLEDKKLETTQDAFKGVKELALEDTFLGWHEICHIAARFPALITLHAGSNQLSSLSPLPPSAPFTTNLVTLDLEFNQFTSLSDLAPLSSLTSLKSLILKKNKISTIAADNKQPPIFSPTLAYIDLSYNLISTWSFVDALPAAFPGLTSLRFTHNPLYDNPDLDTPSTTPSSSAPQPPTTTTTTTATSGSNKTEESYMLLIARLPPTLKALNFSSITPADRSDAEMFYLSRITKQLCLVPETDEQTVLARHPKWKYLCDTYGEPTVVRRQELNPNFLEARLIDVKFWGVFDDAGGGKEVTKEVKVPKSFDIYAVKGIAGRMFGLRPWEVGLVWETGEWDPVGRFGILDGEESEDEDDDDMGEVEEGEGEGEEKKGRWVKREVELKDGPRQFGYCVDGMQVTVRVEKR
ncbi:HotDog domain-containing protein [Triangularia verruculosa]|uniref:HotDog domain-containing protein n=1 Tax=Triangularia verruculosa TaxID=2587418 RepID=A0AAN7APJ0_9PEZI|nr:HotDog domain-containing protein [Triangularia verruculosa]